MLIGCMSNFIDRSSALDVSSIDYKENHIFFETGQYHSITWLSNKSIAVIYKPPYFDGRPQDDRLHIYDIDSEVWDEVEIIFDDSPEPRCRINYLIRLSRLPNGNLGMVKLCNGNEEEAVVEYNMSTGQHKVLQLYVDSPINSVGEFSYSPSMSELIQEDSTGYLLTTTIYYVDNKSNNILQIAPDFIRADRPAWSPHNREILFWGTEKVPDGMLPTQIANRFDLINIVYYPWDLYLSSPDGTNLRKIVSSVEEHISAKWSPTQENIIAFSGIYRNVSGIWLLDLETMNITRIYKKHVSSFDWSLNGKKIVFIETDAIFNGTPIYEHEIGIIDIGQ